MAHQIYGMKVMVEYVAQLIMDLMVNQGVAVLENVLTKGLQAVLWYNKKIAWR